MRKHCNFGTRKTHWPARPASGFTLVELMTVVLVVTILTVIAVPAYTNQVRKSHRTEAKSMLLDIAAREERYLATNGMYATDPTKLGLTAWGVMGSGYYLITISNVAAASASSVTTAATAATFTLTATANTIGNQNKDTQCASLSVDQTGLQSSTNSANAPSTGCW